MAKLSQQLQQRKTRTQRVIEQQEAVREQQEFQTLKDRAKQLQNEKFSKISSIDEYEQEYNLLDPKLKPFFASPQQLREERTDRIETNIEKTQERITYADQQLALARERYNERVKKYDQWFAQLSREQQDKRREQYQKTLREYDDDIEEKEIYWEKYKQGLNEGLERLNKNEDLAFEDIASYSSQLGSYYEGLKEARNQQRMKEYEQQLKVIKLEEKGFKASLQQEYSKSGVSESIQFYNPETNKWADLKIPLATKSVDVSRLEKSELGKTDVTRTIDIAGKEYQFTTKQQLYVSAQGRLTTQIGGTSAKTEAQILKEAEAKFKEQQQQAYEKLLTDYPEKEIQKSEVNQKWYEKAFSTYQKIRYATMPPYLRDVNKLIDQGVAKGGKYAFEKGKQGLAIADEYVRWDFKLTGSPSFPKVQLISFGKEKPTVDVESKVVGFQESLASKSFNIKETEISRQLGAEGYEEFKLAKQEQAQADVTGIFYRSEVGKEAFFTAETEEDVTKSFEEFKKTENYKQYEQQFQKQYQEDLDLMLDEVVYKEKLKGTYAGVKIAGLNFAKLGLGLVKTPTRTALTTGAIVGGGYALSTIPTSVLVGVDIAFLTGGAYMTFAPSSSIEQRGSGAIMVALAGTSLTLKGIKYARQPTVKYKEIKPPKATLRASETIGKTDQGTINKIIYPKQKLSQIGVAGRRTVVSTRWRDWLGLDPIYKGVPYSQRGILTGMSIRGSYQIKVAKSGYEKAFDLLTKRGGYTPYQARSTLRYIQPKVIEQYLERGEILIRGSKAVGEFQYLTKQPVINVDDLLGIKTRGARTIRTYYDVERRLLTTRQGQVFAIEQKTSLPFYLEKRGFSVNLKDLEYSESILFGKQTALKKGFVPLKTGIKDLQAFKEVQYKDIGSVTISRRLFPTENIVKIDLRKSKLINEIVDLTKQKYSITPANIKKTPLSKTFGTGDIEIKGAIKSITRGGGRDVVGQIEKTITQQTSQQTTKAILKDAVAPPQIKLKSQIKNLVNVGVKSDTAIKSLTALAPLSAVKQDSQLKALLKTQLKVDQSIMTRLKEDIAVKQDVAVKQASLQRSALITTPAISPINPNLLSPAWDIPIITTPKIRTQVIPPAFPPAETRKGRRASAKKQIQDLLYLPDFTARAVGLEAETLTEKQAKAQLKKILTGFEIRRPVKVRF